MHGLVNNAGVPYRPRQLDVDIPGWERTLAVNLTGALLGIQALVPFMPSGASIVNIGSIAGLTAHHAVADTVSKWVFAASRRSRRSNWLRAASG